MRSCFKILVATLLTLLLAVDDRGSSLDTAEFGRVQLLTPGAEARGFAIVFSDAGGPGATDHAAIQALSAAGFAVAVIDSRQALSRLERSATGRPCVDIVGALEWLSSTAERDFQWSRYRPPVLLGRGFGGALVYAALAQAPAQTFAGGMSVDVRPALTLWAPLCRVAAGDAPPDGHETLSPRAPLGARWLIGTTSASAPEAVTYLAAARAAAGAHDPTLLPSGPLAALYGEAAERLNTTPTPDDAALLTDLPLVEVSAKTTMDALAIIFSGDGGWRDIDKEVGEVLAARGMAVVGVDSLRYFWSAQTPERVGADLARIIAHYQAAWHVHHVILVGYSFGADILPFAYNRLQADLQRQVDQVSLIAPGRAADFEIRPLGWLGAGPSADARPLSPEAARIDQSKTQCIFGKDDADGSLCTDAAARHMNVIGRPGGHHFDNDYHALANIVLTGGCRRGIACHP